jgi:hypothetical protein
VTFSRPKEVDWKNFWTELQKRLSEHPKIANLNFTLIDGLIYPDGRILLKNGDTQIDLIRHRNYKVSIIVKNDLPEPENKNDNPDNFWITILTEVLKN